MAHDKLLMPTKWQPEHKLFPHQLGFTCPPFDCDATPSDFLRLAPETVGVRGWMLHLIDRAKQIYRRQRPHYEYLYQHWLKA